MGNQNEHTEQKRRAEEEQGESMKLDKEKEKPVVIKIPPQLTALKKAAQKGDPYCEVVENDDKETE